MFIRIGFERLEVAKHPILKEANRMNSHKHARLTYARRLEMVRQMVDWGWSASEAAGAHGVTPATARNWHGRYLAAGEAALADRVVPEIGLTPLVMEKTWSPTRSSACRSRAARHRPGAAHAAWPTPGSAHARRPG